MKWWDWILMLVFLILSCSPVFSLTSFIFIKRLFSSSSLSTIRSDQISHSVVSDSLQPHESQHARPPCPSPTPRVHSDSRPLSQWCHPAISSSVVPSPVVLWTSIHSSSGNTHICIAFLPSYLLLLYPTKSVHLTKENFMRYLSFFLKTKIIKF